MQQHTDLQAKVASLLLTCEFKWAVYSNSPHEAQH